MTTGNNTNAAKVSHDWVFLFAPFSVDGDDVDPPLSVVLEESVDADVDDDVDAVVDVVVDVVGGPIDIRLAATLACRCLLGTMSGPSGLKGPAAAMK